MSWYQPLEEEVSAMIFIKKTTTLTKERLTTIELII